MNIFFILVKKLEKTIWQKFRNFKWIRRIAGRYLPNSILLILRASNFSARLRFLDKRLGFFCGGHMLKMYRFFYASRNFRKFKQKVHQYIGRRFFFTSIIIFFKGCFDVSRFSMIILYLIGLNCIKNLWYLFSINFLYRFYFNKPEIYFVNGVLNNIKLRAQIRSVAYLQYR